MNDMLQNELSPGENLGIKSLKSPSMNLGTERQQARMGLLPPARCYECRHAIFFGIGLYAQGSARQGSKAREGHKPLIYGD